MRKLPHQKLLAYEVAMKLLESVRDARIRDSHLRDQAMRAAKSAVLNTAEAAGRVTRADKARAITIARGEACEAAAAVEVAVAAGDADAAMLDVVLGHADRFVALATGFIR
jgi:four helix bundle protein